MINKCVCFDKSFSQILALVKEKKWTFEDVQKNLGCGTKCGLCSPYIKDCLKTGCTEYLPTKKLK